MAAIRQSPWGRSPDVSASLFHLSGLGANDCAGDGVHRKLVALATGALAGVPDTDCRSWCAPGTLRVAYQTGCSPSSKPLSSGRVYESRGVEGGGGLVSGVGRKCGEESSAVLLYTDVGNKKQFWEGSTASADPAVRTEGWVRGVLLKNVEGTFGCSVRSRVVVREPRVLSVRLLGRIPTLQAAATDCHWDCGGYCGGHGGIKGTLVVSGCRVWFGVGYCQRECSYWDSSRCDESSAQTVLQRCGLGLSVASWRRSDGRGLKTGFGGGLETDWRQAGDRWLGWGQRGDGGRQCVGLPATASQTGMIERNSERTRGKFRGSADGFGRSDDSCGREGGDERRQGDGVRRLAGEFGRRSGDMRRAGDDVRRPRDDLRRLGDGSGQMGDLRSSLTAARLGRPADGFRRSGDGLRRPEDGLRRPTDDFRRSGDDFSGPGGDIRRQKDDLRRLGDEVRRRKDDLRRMGDDDRRGWETI